MTLLVGILLLVTRPLMAQVDDSLKQSLLQGWQADPRKAVEQVKVYAQKAQAKGDKTEYAWALNFEGVVLGALGEYDSSYQCYTRSLAYCKKHGIPEIEKKTQMNLAINFHNQGKYVESAAQYREALQLFEETHDTLGMGHTYSGLGGVSRFLGEDAKAISQYRKAIELYTEIGAIPLTGSVWSNLGVIYRDLGNSDSALYCLELAESLLLEAGGQLALVNVYSNMAGLYERTDPQKAKDYYAKGLALAEEIDAPRGRLVNSAGMARLQLLQQAYPQAISHGNATLALATELDDLQFQAEALNVLHEAHGAMGQHAKAYGYLLRFKSLSDSIAGFESKKAVAELEIKYETAKKEKEIAQQRISLAEQALEAQLAATRNARLTLWLALLSAALIIAVIAGLWIWRVQSEKRRRLRQELELTQRLEAEKRAKEISEEKLRISRELHDNIGSQITYIISSLDNLGYQAVGPATLAQVGDIAGYGREALSDLRQAIWALHVDASFSDVARRSAELGLRHFPSEVLVVEELIAQDWKLNATEAIHLLRIVQEALQNAAKYAQAPQVRLRFASDDKGWEVEISDTGIGFELGSLPQGEGLGLNGMQARAQAMQAHLTVKSRPGQGTSILLQKR